MKKYKIGYTSGVYDMFHIGHLNILERAKERCDRLIVGVSTDELVEEYKHKRPVIPFEQRIKIVQAIRFVDEVIPQVSMNKMTVWEKYHFNAIFIGDDWKGTDRWNHFEEVLARINVDVVYVPYTQGISTTEIKRKITEI